MTGVRVVRAHVTIASREVAVPVSLDLLWLRMPVEAFLYPAKERSLAAEVGDLLNTVAVLVVVVLIGSAGVAASPSVPVPVVVAVLVVVAAATFPKVVDAAAGLRNWLWSKLDGNLRGVLRRMTSGGIGGNMGGFMFLISFWDIGGYCDEWGGGHLLVLRDNGVSNRVIVSEEKQTSCSLKAPASEECSRNHGFWIACTCN